MINLKKFYKGKKVFITGATGFKGAWLCLWLNYLGAKVYRKYHTYRYLFDRNIPFERHPILEQNC